VSDAVIGTELRLIERSRRWSRVALPDERQGWIADRDISDPAGLIHLDGGRPEEVLRTAFSFRGFPYLWGGTTPKGFDCSGLVQTVFRLNGFRLPRDAYQQQTCGQEVADQKELKPADLLFFRARGGNRIAHVAIHIQGGQFIHCSGWVKINSLDRSAGDYEASLRDQYAGAKRVMGGLAGRC
jgi:cell wall-associated NlpC family hydrolase